MAITIDYSSYPDRERRAAFTNKLIPESPYKSAGITIPECRKLAKTLPSDDIQINYIEDIVIKGIMIFSAKKPFREKTDDIESFLPHLVSWMVTDVVSSSLKYRKEEDEEVFSYFFSLIDRKEPMTRRFGIVTLLSLFKDRVHTEKVLQKLVTINGDHYLLSMAAAWYVATAYTYDAELTTPYFKRLDATIKKMAKQKCRDSRRISAEAKEALKLI